MLKNIPNISKIMIAFFLALVDSWSKPKNVKAKIIIMKGKTKMTAAFFIKYPVLLANSSKIIILNY